MPRCPILREAFYILPGAFYILREAFHIIMAGASQARLGIWSSFPPPSRRL